MRRWRAAGPPVTLLAGLEAPGAPLSQFDQAGGGLLTANVARDVLEDAGKPVSPALACVVILTVLFFGTYLAVVGARLGRVFTGGVTPRRGAATTTPPEALLSKAVEALPLAPMVAVLLVCTRLRELQHGAARQPWLHLTFWVSTAAVMLRMGVAVAAAALRASGGGGTGCLSAAGAAVSLLLYGSCAVIVVNVFTPLSAEWADPLLESDAALRCCGVIVAAHLAEQLFLELLGEDKSPKRSQAEATSFSKVAETMSLQLPLLLCVLLAGIQMRAMQLSVVPAPWARSAMHATAVVAIMQALFACGTAAARRVAAPRPEGRDPEGGAATPAGAGTPAPTWVAEGSMATAVCWGLLVSGLYVGTGAILGSIFAMEPEPFDAVMPVSLVHLLHLGGLAATASPPVSNALKCVVVLVAASFASYLCLVLGLLLSSRKRAAAAVDTVGRALAFVPMICMMMIALRLRSGHLGLPDPQSWAQATMWVATASVVVQVVCSLLMLCVDGESPDDADEDDETTGALAKVVAIVLTALRYLGSFALYLSVAVLIVALVVM